MLAVRHGFHNSSNVRYVYLFAREPSKWQVEDVEHLGRLVFSLSTKQINSIPLVSTQRPQPKQIIHFIALQLVF